MDTSVAYTADCVPPKPIHTSLYRLDGSLDWLMGEYLRLLLFRQPQEGLYLVKAVHKFSLVKQYLAVRVVDDALLHDGRRDDVVHLLRHPQSPRRSISDRLVHIAQISAMFAEERGLPSLFHDELFPDAFQPPHLVDKCFHDDNRNHRKKLGIILHRINFEDHEPLVQQVDVLRGVEQEVVPSALVNTAGAWSGGCRC